MCLWGGVWVFRLSHFNLFRIPIDWYGLLCVLCLFRNSFLLCFVWFLYSFLNLNWSVFSISFKITTNFLLGVNWWWRLIRFFYRLLTLYVLFKAESCFFDCKNNSFFEREYRIDNSFLYGNDYLTCSTFYGFMPFLRIFTRKWSSWTRWELELGSSNSRYPLQHTHFITYINWILKRSTS